MSSYLTFYLVPKKTRKKYDYNKDDGHTEIEVELSTGTPLALMSYSRSNDIYRAFNETLNPAYAGMEEKYQWDGHLSAQNVKKKIIKKLLFRNERNKR